MEEDTQFTPPKQRLPGQNVVAPQAPCNLNFFLISKSSVFHHTVVVIPLSEEDLC